MMQCICPLCSNQTEVIIETLDAQLISNLYRERFDLDVASNFGDVKHVYLMHCCWCDLRFFAPSIEGAEEFYKSLGEKPWYYESIKEEYRVVAGFIAPGSSVLDVGCGIGHFFLYLTDSDYTGVEQNNDAVRKASELGRNVVCGNLAEHEKTHFKRYNYVCCFQVFEHVENIREFIESCFELLLPDGELVLTVPSYDSYISRVVNGVLNVPPHHLTWWSKKALISLADNCGISLMGLYDVSLMPSEYIRYSFYTALKYISDLTGSEKKVVDVSLGYKIRCIVALPVAAFIYVCLIFGAIRPAGHTVIARFTKAIH
ncbi:MAG: class I SAM-dependent methyltransferase [Blastocatellales bacterium]